MKTPHVIIIGAGAGGLSSAMILAQKGYSVTVFEKEAVIGGRNAPLRINNFTFDIGPTILILSFVLKNLFHLVGKNIEDYINLVPVEPIHRLSFSNGDLIVSIDRELTKERIRNSYPGQEKGLDLFYSHEKKRFEHILPGLQKNCSNLFSMLSLDTLSTLPYLSLTRNLYDTIGNYFSEPELKLAFCFHSKYLGMSPWRCPALFTFISYAEHAFGVEHCMGGLNSISTAMGRIIREFGGEIFTSEPVEKIVIHKGRAQGVQLKSGERVSADAVVINADFPYAASSLFPTGMLKKYSQSRLDKKEYSCSTFMMYLCVDKIYNEPHHSILFADDYRSSVDDITLRGKLPDDLSIYLHNPSVLDPSLAPPGKSSVYVLAPVPNLQSGIQWTKELKEKIREQVLTRISERTSMKDLRLHIIDEKIISPDEWQNGFNIYQGAVFSLSHILKQMLYWRPHNRFEECKGCYLVGGGTHPGSGLPTIYQSAIISSQLIVDDFNQS